MARKTDRRVRRTRRLLREALMRLSVERGYDAITVRDIAEAADVARSTFYLHYRDKDDLLYSSMTEIYAELAEAMRPDPDAPAQMNNPADWQHIAENADFYRVMLGEHGSAVFLTQMRRFLAGLMGEQVVDPLQAETPRVPPGLIAWLLAGAQIGMVIWWLENDMPHLPEEIAQMGQDVVLNGLLWALGHAG